MPLGSIDTGPALNSLAYYQQQLATATAQASSGNRIVNASIDPSGLAIYNNLVSQAEGSDTANQNISQASDAVNVAQGATSGIQDALGQLQNLAIEANNGFNSPTDNAALQTQANALVAQINGDASTVNFNGTALLTGANSGTTPATTATATTTNNDDLAAGGNVIASTAASAATTSGTINVSIANTGAGAVANVTFTDSTTQQVTNIGQFAANSVVNVNGTQVTLGNFTTNDTNQTATVQTAAATAGSVNPTISVQSGANQGQTTAVTIPNATTSGLGITNIDLSTPTNATNSLGQIQTAITNLGAGQAQLGAQTNALQNQFNNNNTYSVNLTQSASSIGDVNEASVSSELNSLKLLQQISIQTINNANVTNGYLNRFFSVTA
ncbi:MAG TPA: flagellin [Candidatus Lustribacter sp.]|nr:flagellin [Candidatus Lustribacter sp.]